MKTNCESEKERWYGRRFKERQRCVRHIKIHVHVQTLQTIGGMKTILVAAGAYKSTDKLLFRICMILCISLSRKPRRIRCPVANIVKGCEMYRSFSEVALINDFTHSKLRHPCGLLRFPRTCICIRRSDIQIGLLGQIYQHRFGGVLYAQISNLQFSAV